MAEAHVLGDRVTRRSAEVGGKFTGRGPFDDADDDVKTLGTAGIRDPLRRSAHEVAAALELRDQALGLQHVEQPPYLRIADALRETADIVVPANLCEVVYEVPVNP
ncbi:hypothetical protein [Actinacidiphila sp. bgisy145]|uniref:hypothetical protein n=1 Tax=Actinacidiphila sp. bgisy145 TaxID=3413792 RepID=UPI003EBF021F